MGGVSEERAGDRAGKGVGGAYEKGRDKRGLGRRKLEPGSGRGLRGGADEEGQCPSSGITLPPCPQV